MSRRSQGPQAGPDADAYLRLFEQVCHLLVQPSTFNQAMPQEFRVTARQWLAGDAATLAHMGEVQHRHFMLGDLHGDVHLSRATGAGWR